MLEKKKQKRDEIEEVFIMTIKMIVIGIIILIASAAILHYW